LVSILTPSESNVYSKLGFRTPYDSFGVERVFERINFYKHAIPSGLGVQKCHKLFILGALIFLTASNVLILRHSIQIHYLQNVSAILRLDRFRKMSKNFLSCLGAMENH